MELVDALGCSHQAADLAATRIVSLVPSITELLCELGLTSLLVGRTGFCIHPRAAVAGIAKVGGTKDVNVEKIRKLKPTHVIVNIDENEKPTVDALAQFIPHVIVTHPLAPRDNLNLYRLLGGIFGAEESAERLCVAFERAWSALPPRPPASCKTVLYCIWKDPWMTVSRDTYIARMLELIGWRQWSAAEAIGDAARYPKFEWGNEVWGTIDAVLLSTEPYRFTQAHVAELQRELNRPVRLVDGEMLSWYGSRAIRGLHYLRALATTAQPTE
ncbi:MAG: ABC transporter substrate-binding protein [Burkholderiaceae bacterium]|nr:ABC transporter substrate-binding protein [Burkholderiaceae bacterium]